MANLKELILRLYTSLLRGDSDGVRRLVTDDFVDHAGRPGTPSGVFSLIRLVEEETMQVPAMGLTIEDMIEENDRIAVRWSLHTIRFPDQHSGPGISWIRAKGITIYRVVDGRIAERWAALSL